MKNIKYVARFLCTMLFLSISIESVSYAMERHDRHEHYSQRRSHGTHLAEDVIWPVLGFFGAITGLYALGRWCGWWGSESNELLLARGRKHLEYAHAYQPMLHIMKSVGCDPLHSFDESILYQLALAKRGGKSIDAYITCLRACVRDASSSRTALGKRLYNLKRDCDWDEVRAVCYHLDHIGNQLDDMLQELKPFLSYLEAHVSYFKLFDNEDYVRNQYARELQLLEQYGDDYALMRQLRICVMSKHSGAFALIEFAQKLKRDIAKLDDLAMRPAYHYAARIGYVRDVVRCLWRIHECIVSDVEYTRLLTEYDRAQREKERLQLERERVQAEQRKADAREREATARERAACAQETKNLLKAAELAERHIYERRY